MAVRHDRPARILARDLRPSASALSPLVLALALASCGGGDRGSGATAPSREHPLVVPSTWHLETMVRRVTQDAGADAIEIATLTPPGTDPRHWRPAREQIAELQLADALLLHGAQLETWADKVSLPLGRLTETTDAFQDELIVIEDSITHSHGPGVVHKHEGAEPHTFLDPVLATRQLDAVAAALIALLPDREKELQLGRDRFAKELSDLDRSYRAMTPQLEGKVLLATGSTWGYLARRYGWALETVNLQGDVVPTADEIADAVAKVAGRPCIVLWESRPATPVTAKLDAALDARHVTFRPGVVRPDGDEADWLATITAGRDALRAAAAGE